MKIKFPNNEEKEITRFCKYRTEKGSDLGVYEIEHETYLIKLINEESGIDEQLLLAKSSLLSLGAMINLMVLESPEMEMVVYPSQEHFNTNIQTTFMPPTAGKTT
jgi:hypothetical protein